MDKALTAETIEVLMAACMELPWLDEIRMNMKHVHAVTIIPSDDVSTEEKLMLTFSDETGVPQRISVLMQDITTELGFEQSTTAIVHKGGACYTFHQANGRSLSIPTDDISAETYVRVLFLLKEISLMAQAQFIVNAR
ncbi:MAG: hypothetical protein ETSY2_29780 [Candidatus Entotheonella gemina]|uniref:Uncharacterized protein n=1 Tax=Candidatus Entotheonella gemina TaxID=1429439 RepID=W4M2A2_9BACT|nr:MAG: hypothetical protein ETSY2_29780 [Candidatus Entotheonella gemina]